MAALVLVGCSSATPTTNAPENKDACYADYSEIIYSGTGQQRSLNNLLSHAHRSKYVLLGEIHTNPMHHANQLRIVQLLAERGMRLHVLFEMLDPKFNPVLVKYQRDGASSETLQNALQWSARGWPIWPSYFPLFEAAKTHSFDIRGANIPGDLLPYVTLYGGLAFPRRQRNEIGLGEDDPFLGDRDVMNTLIQQSHGVEDEIVPALVIAQYAKDAHMAYELSQSPTRSILIAGNYHVQSNIGVPVHLAKHDPHASVVSVGMIELTYETPEPKVFFESTPKELRDYDFLWFTDTRCQTSDSDSE